MVQLELVHFDVVQRLGHPVRLRLGDLVVQPDTDGDISDNADENTRDADPDMADNVDEDTRDADQDEALHDADNVQSDEDIGISIGDLTTFTELRETINTFAASNNFLVISTGKGKILQIHYSNSC